MEIQFTLGELTLLKRVLKANSVGLESPTLGDGKANVRSTLTSMNGPSMSASAMRTLIGKIDAALKDEELK